MNPYIILGVKPSANQKEIEAAFRSKAKKCHPDLNPGDTIAKDNFILLQEAYRSALSNLSSASNAKTAPKKPKRKLVSREVWISISEAIQGTSIKLDGASGPCGCCDGSGFTRNERPVSCEFCSGSGVSGFKEHGIIRVKAVCSHCDGSGKTTRTTCTQCYGFGTTPEQEVTVEIPAGCLDGDNFLVEGGVSNPSGNVLGDLELVVRLKADNTFTAIRENIETKLEVEVWEAALGTNKKVPSPDGNEFSIKIPAGSQHGSRFRMRGHGIRKNATDTMAGDFIVILAVKIPTAFDGKAKVAFENLRDALQK